MQQLGRYQILDELGRGAMGVVYRALDPAIGRPVAIKTIRLRDISDGSERERLRERLFREAQSAGQLSHPGIVTIYDVGEQQEVTYIAMEYVKGKTLETLMSGEEALPPERIIGILRQTAAALDYAHRKGIVHRDIKPANVMVSDDDGAVKITDFGVAKLAASAQMTHPGTVVGTPNYMAPEQVEGRAVDGRADQFALAVIAYEMLTGEKPFAGEHMTSVLYKIVSDEPAAPHALNPALPWAASVVLGRAMSKDPAKRYPTAAEFIAALEAALNSRKDWKGLPRGASEAMPTSVAPQPPPAPAREEPTTAHTEPVKPGRGFFWQAVAAALAGIAVVIVLFIAAGRWLGADDGIAEQPHGQAQARVPGQRPAPMPPPVLIAPPQPGGRAPGGTMPAQVPPEEGTAVSTTPLEGTKPVQEAQSGAQPVQAAETAPAVVPPQPPSAPGRETHAPKPAASSRETQYAAPAAAPDSAAPARRRAEAQPPASAQAVRAAQPPPESGRYTLQVTTSPPGASIVLDSGAGKCTSPCSIELVAGRHTVASTLAGYRRELRIVELMRPQELFVIMKRLAGTVRVESDPPGAQVVIDGVVRRETTPASFVLPEGRHNFAVISGGRRVERDVVVRDGGLYALTLNP